jgi:hypothetical protein
MTVKLGTADITITDKKLVVTPAVQGYLQRKGEVSEQDAVAALEAATILAIAALEARVNAIVEAFDATIETNPAADFLDDLRNDEV